MTEISPTYYADGVHLLNFTLKGEGFIGIPNDAVAVPMIDNDNPLQFRYADDPVNKMEISNRKEGEVTFTAKQATYHRNTSIGAILSKDRSNVIWVNNTKPLR